MSFDFLGSATPQYGSAVPNQIYQNPMTPNPQFAANQQQIVNNAPVPMQPQRPVSNFQMPEIVMTSSNTDNKTYMPSFSNIGAVSVENPVVNETKKERTPRKKKENGSNTAIVKLNSSAPADPSVSGTIEDVPTAYTYAETTGMLRDTLCQIDALSSELVQEFNTVRASRTMKNKYGALTNISENIGSLLSSKIAAIREINSSISKSNDLDYKKFKDIKAAQDAKDDDTYIANLYKSFISNPATQPTSPQMPDFIMPMVNEGSMMGSGIIRANVDNSGNIMGGDQAYLNYMSNLSPEQNLMLYEQNPNVKQVVVFDHATGNKFFQMMDMSTGQVVPNLPVYDQDFMADTTLDLNKGIAKNLNLNETFPIIEINKESVMNQY